MRLMSTGLPSRIAIAVSVGLATTFAPAAAASPSVKPESDTAKPESQHDAPAGDRIISLDMNLISFNQQTISVQAGETVRFLLRNTSDIPHEFTIGNAAVQKGRRAVLSELKNAEMLDYDNPLSIKYDGPSSVVVLPGRMKLLRWKFTETQDLQFGCNLPGHYEMGMKGKFVVSNPNSTTASLKPSVQAPAIPVVPELPNTEIPAPDAATDNTQAPKIEPKKPATVRAKRPNPIAQEYPQATAPGSKKTTAVRTQVVPLPVKKPPREKPQRQVMTVLPPSDATQPATAGVLQLAAVRSASEAEATWQRLARRHAHVLRDREHFVVRADFGSRGVFYRLRVRGFESQQKMLRACASIRTRGDTCIGIVASQTAPRNEVADPARSLSGPERSSLR